MPSLILGPLLRYVGETEASVIRSRRDPARPPGLAVLLDRDLAGGAPDPGGRGSTPA